MKTILLHIRDDAGRDGRLSAAVQLARVLGAQLTCLQVTPLAAYIASDIFGGVFVMPDVMENVRRQEEELRAATESVLAGAGVPWTYLHADGEIANAIAGQSRLADLVVLGRALLEDGDDARQPSFAGDVVLHTRAPVLALPVRQAVVDLAKPALVAWSGSFEAANALRAALPLLRAAAGVDLVTVGGEPDIPAADAADYLSRHGIRAEARTVPAGSRDGDVADTLLRIVEETGPGLVVQGAYGHSRAREYIFGGVTRRMMDACPVPLLMAH